MASTARRHVGMPSPERRLEPGAPPPPPPPRFWPAAPASPQRRPALFADVLPARELAPPRRRRLTAGQVAFLQDLAALVCIIIVFGAPAAVLWMRG